MRPGSFNPSGRIFGPDRGAGLRAWVAAAGNKVSVLSYGPRTDEVAAGGLYALTKLLGPAEPTAQREILAKRKSLASAYIRPP